MANDKPGIFKRIFSWVGKLVSAIRWMINLLFLVIIGFFLINLLGQDVKPLPEKAALLLEPSGVLVEERSYKDPLTQLMQQSSPHDAETPVSDLTEALEHAATDKRITGVVLDLSYLQRGDITKLSAVGQAIKTFKESGKPVIAIADNYTQDQYYLASFADEIRVNPMGGVLLHGFGYFGNYFKDAVEKLKINLHVFRAGQYKSAVEPFTRNDMSDEARENARSWITQLWAQYTADVEANRQLNEGAVDNYVAQLPASLAQYSGDFAALALNTGLVDKVDTRPETTTALISKFGADENSYSKIHHKTYLAHTRLPILDAPDDKKAKNIGLIVATGSIIDGEQMEGNIGGDTLSKLLRQAREDNSLKALVLRVDSPGGSAFASDLIRQELLNVKQTMPVIISMGSVAASGGYWIAAQADEIWAAPTTITGSIGVFGIVPTFEKSLGALGINSDGVGTTPLADAYHLDRPLSDAMSTIVELSITNIYQKFISLVAEGRDKSPQAIEAIAGGRVWTGRQALELGLVDQLGGLDEAIAAAADRAGLDSWKVKPITRPLSFQEQLLKQLAQGGAKAISAISPLQGVIGKQMESISNRLVTLRNLNDPQNIYLQCFSCPN